MSVALGPDLANTWDKIPQGFPECPWCHGFLACNEYQTGWLKPDANISYVLLRSTVPTYLGTFHTTTWLGHVILLEQLLPFKQNLYIMGAQSPRNEPALSFLLMDRNLIWCRYSHHHQIISPEKRVPKAANVEAKCFSTAKGAGSCLVFAR